VDGDGVLTHLTPQLTIVFILEGILTCILSLIGFWIIPDFPEEAKFLTDPEREFIIHKLQKDTGNSAYQDLSWRKVGQVFKDWKIWVGGFQYLGLIVPAYGIPSRTSSNI
jgi:hypothetical protein